MNSDHERCVCGRVELHCPSCGRGMVYAVKSLNLYTRGSSPCQPPEADTVIRGYRCRRCGVDFRSNTTCTATPLPVVSPVTTTQVNPTTLTPEKRRELLVVIATVRGPQAAVDQEKLWQEQGLL